VRGPGLERKVLAFGRGGGTAERKGPERMTTEQYLSERGGGYQQGRWKENEKNALHNNFERKFNNSRRGNDVLGGGKKQHESHDIKKEWKQRGFEDGSVPNERGRKKDRKLAKKRRTQGPGKKGAQQIWIG